MRRIFALSSLFVIGFVFSACSQPAHLQEMKKTAWSPERVTFPELEEVSSWNDTSNGNRPGMSHSFFINKLNQIQDDAREEARTTKNTVSPDFKPLVQFTKDPGFQSRLKALETATIPSKYALPERDEARRKYIEEWTNMTKLLTTPKTPVSAIQASLEKLSLYMEQMRYIPGQTPPTGDAAKKYAGIAAYEDPYKK